jgi:hypothetical protein
MLKNSLQRPNIYVPEDISDIESDYGSYYGSDYGSDYGSGNRYYQAGEDDFIPRQGSDDGYDSENEFGNASFVLGDMMNRTNDSSIHNIRYDSNISDILLSLNKKVFSLENRIQALERKSFGGKSLKKPKGRKIRNKKTRKSFKKK